MLTFFWDFPYPCLFVILIFFFFFYNLKAQQDFLKRKKDLEAKHEEQLVSEKMNIKYNSELN